MKRVIGYLKEFAGRMTVGFIIKTMGTVVELFLPLILSHILKNVIGRSMGDVLPWGALMII